MSLYRNDNKLEVTTRVMLPVAYRGGWLGNGRSIPCDIWEEYAHPSTEKERVVVWVKLNNKYLDKIFGRTKDVAEITTLMDQGLISKDNRYLTTVRTHMSSYKLLMGRPAVKIQPTKRSPRTSLIQTSRRPFSELVQG